MITPIFDEGVERTGPGRAPTAFRIWRAGENKADDGPVTFTERSAGLLLAEQASRGRPMSIDFDHLSVSENRPATAGRAAGYFRLETRPTESGPELWAIDVEWCEDVRDGLEQNPPLWRYFSPYWHHAKGDESREVIGLTNLALCINPMTHGIPILASRKASVVRHATRSLNTEAGMTADEMLSLLDAQIEATEDADLKAALTAGREALAAKKTDEEPAEDVADAAKDDDDEKKKKDDDEEDKKSSAPSAEATKHAASVSEDSVTSLTRKVIDLERRAELSEINALLAKTPGLPIEFQKHCRTQSLDSAKLMIAAVATTKHSATRNTKPAQGAPTGDGLDPRIGDEMDRAMGVRSSVAVMPRKLPDGRFVMHNVRPSDLARMNAQKEKA